MQSFTVSRTVDGKIATAEIHLVANGCFYFFNAQHLYLKISSIERSYFDFMCEKMDYQNRVEINGKLRNGYIKHYNKVTSSKKAPSERTLQRYEDKLKSLNLIISINEPGALCFINPKYVFRGTLTARWNLMNKLADMAFRGAIDLSAIIDRPVDSIKPN